MYYRASASRAARLLLQLMLWQSCRHRKARLLRVVNYVRDSIRAVYRRAAYSATFRRGRLTGWMNYCLNGGSASCSPRQAHSPVADRFSRGGNFCEGAASLTGIA